MHQPHFDIQGMTKPPAPVEGNVGECLIRAAACLTALLQGPTVSAGLNESRYNVLDALRRMPGETSTQTELAARLLQSESNLSTLLERMRLDALISRERSEADRRKSSISLTRAGREALDRADLARSRAMATVFKSLEDPDYAALRTSLLLLLQRFEGQLGIAPRVNNAVTVQRPAKTTERQPFQGASLISDGLTS